MTALRAAALWLGAVALCLVALSFVLRGRPAAARARGAAMARVLRVAAFLLALAGLRLERGEAQPPAGGAASSATDADYPAAARGPGLDTYVELHAPGGPFARLGGVLARVDEPGWAARPEPERAGELALARELAAGLPAPTLAAELGRALERMRAGRPHTIAELDALLDAAERTPAFEAWLGAWVLRRSGEARASAADRAALYARIERHLRVAEALERAAARVGPPMVVPWRRMSAPPRDYRATRAPAGLDAEAERLHATLTLDSWVREGSIELTLAASSAPVRLWRRGTASSVSPGASFHLGRLDVLAAPRGAQLEHRELGRIELPRGAVADARSLPVRLDGPQRARVVEWIARARAGEEGAIAALEASLPAAHALLREEIAARPGASGTARLRTLLALFDE